MFRTLSLAITALVAVAIAMPMSTQEHISMGADSKPLYKNSTRAELDMSEKMYRSKRSCRDVDQCSFIDKFKTKDTKRWTFADNYANGESFAAWWSKDRIFFKKERKTMLIKVGRTPGHGKPYVSGQMQSKRWHGYGCYEVRMKPANQQGLVTTFFSFTGEYDAAPGKPKKHNEVDIEFVYKRKYKKVMLQANYFTNGRGNHEQLIKLPFDVVKKMNNYGFKWTSKKIAWFVNGKQVYSTKKNIPRIEQGPHKIMMSLWPVSEISASWAGRFQWRGPTSASYAAMRFTRGEDCRIYNSF